MPERKPLNNIIKAATVVAAIVGMPDPVSAQHIQNENAISIESIRQNNKKLLEVLTQDQFKELDETKILDIGTCEINLSQLPENVKKSLTKLLDQEIENLEALQKNIDFAKDLDKYIQSENEIKRHIRYLEGLNQKKVRSVAEKPITFKIHIKKIGINNIDTYILQALTFEFGMIFHFILNNLPLNTQINPGFTNLIKLDTLKK